MAGSMLEKFLFIASVLEIIYQLKVLSAIHPGQLLIVAFLLAIVPYILVRGPINRLLRFIKTYHA